MSRAWSFDRFGLEHLRLVEVDEPAPGPGQVTLAVTACSVNYRDTLMVAGQYDPRMPLPLVPLSDGVGRVIAVGEGVDRVAVGDRVAATFAPRWIAGEPERSIVRLSRGGPLPGMLAERRTLDAEGVVKVPEHLTDEEAATLPCAALTAWSSLVTEGNVTAGSTLLVQGTGGVSLFALQLGKLLGARVMITSSSDEKLERAKALGADATLNYRTTPEWGRPAAKWAGDGVDLVVEVGGAKTFEESLKAVRMGGIVSLIGNLSGSTAPVPLTRILMSQVRVQGILVGHRAGFEAMNRALAAHPTVRPVVDRVFAFDEAPEALRHLRAGDHFGKVVIRVAA